ncbi:TrkA-N domain-containing protein [Halosimplex carlsbadense 2-9-1]|uniref:TrkA-N domain-containing protein n=1 Tax=Halosimplex carlsbadense 2-9-1 TaxID=797114 RepID=M0CW82_9EURY|nr:cation:proton antiporter [Halosimplex carlsbadense]ELZ27486.1 TrkA-N domain-containing protein [Halosimplex carlsbadense 2-9-1]
MAESTLLLLVAGIIAIGVLAQILADRLQVPAIVFYIVAGLVLGRPGLNIVTGETFGGALSTVVGFAVAIIVFEGAFHLKIERIKAAPQAALRLVTVGAVVALAGTAVAVRLVFGVSWNLSLVIGSLLVATGPTVVTPILSIVPVRDRVATALEFEGIVNDVTAAILAVVFFQTVLPETAGNDIIRGFVVRLGVGLLFGIVVAGVVYYLLRYVDLSPGDAPRNARLLVLAGALVAFAAANFEATEAGVAATATAGFLLGNADVPYEAEIEAFKGDLTLLVLAFVFIGLAALLDPGALAEVGLGGLAVVAVIALVIRPALVFLSTAGDRFTRQERTFMSLVGPRGIIPASVATLFAVQLQNANLVREANVLLGTVFLAILLTAVFEGGLARHLARYLNVIPMRVIIVGGGRVGRSLAERLENRGENVVIVEEDESVAQAARNDGYTVIIGDGTDTEVLREAGADNAKTVVAATGDDDANLLVAQLSSSKFDVEKVIARANNPDNVDAFEDLGVRTISASMATAWAIDNQIERPAIAHWMTDVGRTGDVQEIEVTNEKIAGKPVSEVGPMLPDACLIALVGKGDYTTAEVPGPDYVIELGDHVTLLGQRESVREGMELVNPD